MGTDNFFEKQTEITKEKVEAYHLYVRSYIMKILMQFGKCVIGDLFCGPGMNGDKPGSPMILVEEALKCLSNNVLLTHQPAPVIGVVFNDKNADNIANLKTAMGTMDLPPNLKLNYFEEDIDSLVQKMSKDGKSTADMPKLFFLDPFTFTSISMGQLISLMRLPKTEVLLFLPAFDAYRFAGTEKLEQCDGHKTKLFLEEFTTHGSIKYPSFDEFRKSMEAKIRASISGAYVRMIILDSGKRKNALVFITKHFSGLKLMNEIAWKQSEDGTKILVSSDGAGEGQICLFGKEEMDECLPNISEFQEGLWNWLLRSGGMYNDKIVQYTILRGFLPGHANAYLKKRRSELDVWYTMPDKKSGLYLGSANCDKRLCRISIKQSTPA